MKNTSKARNKKTFFGVKNAIFNKKCNFTAKSMTTHFTSDNSHSNTQVKLHSYTKTIRYYCLFYFFNDCSSCIDNDIKLVEKELYLTNDFCGQLEYVIPINICVVYFTLTIVIHLFY